MTRMDLYIWLVLKIPCTFSTNTLLYFELRSSIDWQRKTKTKKKREKKNAQFIYTLNVELYSNDGHSYITVSGKGII